MPPSLVSSASWLPATTCEQPLPREKSACGTLVLNAHPPNRERLPPIEPPYHQRLMPFTIRQS